MTFFEHYFNEYDFSKKETAVCCPFPHHTSNGINYKETNPSAHVNLDKRVYHCKVCGAQYSEVGFISEVLGCTYENAIKIQQQFRNDNDDIFNWQETVTLPAEIKQKALDLGISEDVIKELNIGSEEGDEISFPVFMFGKILDVRSYRPGGNPKIKSRSGSNAGHIIPFDIWRDSPTSKWTILCAGEKDMAVARSHGLNAITLTGGELTLPLYKNYFKERKVAICYDNDTAGLRGAHKLAAYLYEIAQEVKIITGFHSVCIEEGEDITDFFTKYGGTREQLVSYIKETKPYSFQDVQEEKERTHPLITLIDATKPQYINKIVRSNIQIVATFETSFVVPTTIIATKTALAGDTKYDKLLLNEKRTWYLDEDGVADVLKLVDNNFNEEQIAANIREILYISKNERNIRVDKPTKETVHKCAVTDSFEMYTSDYTPFEFTAYSLKRKLESGKKYRATYKIVPHPYKGQALTMIILDVEEAADSISNFVITDEVKNNLDVIRTMPGTVPEKINDLTERVKGILNYNGYNQLIQTIDLSFHTVLEFNFGNHKNIRGYLDTLVVAESRVGKSTTTNALQQLYGLGTITSLAGSSATVPGLIGGSNKVNGSFQTRAGIIPQNHRGLIIFEELAKSNSNILKELTDIKSSNQVRITRVSGSITLPALVRMITLTNTRSSSDSIRSIASYPNGIEIVTDLIGTPEDIARFDLMLVLGGRGSSFIDPLWQPALPLSQHVYKTRIRWVWSRTPEQILIDKDVAEYIIEQSNILNSRYDSYIKIFGTEAWKKITRLAISTAGYLVSTDSSYQNIIVKKEHVDYAVQFLIELYDNETFRLKEYVDRERSYNEIDDDGIKLLQDLYTSAPSLLLTLTQNSISNRQSLIGSTGLDNDSFNKVMNQLIRALFVKYQGYDIIPTERFRLGMQKINKKIRVTKVGEPDV